MVTGGACRVTPSRALHVLDAEVLLGRERVVSSASQRGIIHAGGAPAGEGTLVMEFEQGCLAAALTASVLEGAAAAVALPHGAGHCRRRTATVFFGVFSVVVRAVHRLDGIGIRAGSRIDIAALRRLDGLAALRAGASGVLALA